MDNLMKWMVETLCEITNIQASCVQASSELIDLGVDSLTAVQLIDLLESYIYHE